jgi:hypothetical protein
MKNDYPVSDFPLTFYFNGEAMPLWGQCWMACNLTKHADVEMDGWDQGVTSHDLWMLYCRIDHGGCAESEDERRFRVCIRVLLKIVLTKERGLEWEAESWAAHYGTTGPEVVRGIRDALLAMSALTERDGLAMWTTGYEADRQNLCETMRRVRLPKDSPEWQEMPHVARERFDTRLQLEGLRKDLVKLVRAGDLPKEIRSVIHQMRVEKHEQS